MDDLKRTLSKKPIIENEYFSIYGENDLENNKEELLEALTVAIKRFLDFFKLNSFKKISINLFSDHDTYLDFTRQLYEPAPYSKGNFANGMINYTYDINAIDRLKSDLIHKLVHLLYEQIWKGKYERILWLDEGLAQYLSGEKNLLEKEYDTFKGWFLSVIIRRDKIIPKIEFLKKHGNTYGNFVDEEFGSYNGYDLSYLMVRYIFDNGEDIEALLNDIDKIRALESSILENTIKYYGRLFCVDKIKQNFSDINSPMELMDYMNKNIIYGWIDNLGEKHVGNLKKFRENYKTSSLDEVIKTGLGTCIEQAQMIKSFFDRIGLENKMYCYRRYETEANFDNDVRMHCFVVFFHNGKWYHFEHSDSFNRGIHVYDTLENALKKITYRPDKEDIRELTEIPNAPAGLSFKEFNEYVNSFNPLSPLEYKKTL